jgi:predicted phosphoadenosine phosphosulfate sulfurtransferase
VKIDKQILEQDVLDASMERIKWTLENFQKVCVSFSGGKDSSIMLNLTVQLARRMKKKISILFIDWEAQFSHTINHVELMRTEYSDITERFYWVALPLTTQNGLSQFSPPGNAGNPAWNGYDNPLSMPLQILPNFPFMSTE